MPIYEKDRSNITNYIYHQHDNNLNFPLNIHNSFEFIIVLDGRLDLTIENKIYKLKKNDCAIIFPNQLHAYSTSSYSESYLCVFSNDMVYDFAEIAIKFEAINPIFRIKKVNRTFINKFKNTSEIFYKKSVLYDIISNFNRQADYVNRQKLNHDFISETLFYVENNFTANISLDNLSQLLGYDYHYISSLFNKNFALSFSELVNEYRIAHGIKLLLTTNYTISEVATYCGYNSLRSFNRNFSKLKGVSPTQFKKYHK